MCIHDLDFDNRTRVCPVLCRTLDVGRIMVHFCCIDRAVVVNRSEIIHFYIFIFINDATIASLFCV